MEYVLLTKELSEGRENKTIYLVLMCPMTNIKTFLQRRNQSTENDHHPHITSHTAIQTSIRLTLVY